ncbi:menaquinone biosynthesis decarboxylase [Thermus scotoductus]|uniref:Menaquinone biosynthesis decarboxylase n=1 Tax=Thermus scotoductus TaxID=37636 RepID=A0A430SD63_THESC|nr:menaquinone biosynthesis decarboxylase [Thermus scotoductus]RTG98407.1 menaquinone biosynthesis decarboxylase [Thermus scotoductus]RTH07773.1 menaquinone biosynthesis decarboxylase [Thermus scotoductus]RTH10385.1 menaquinone biosynthesis decarboxylase [Thermus scotoductus]RTH13616.1 menaquinone biosynthesis decarboxylase [Thermus scotoductus]RTH16712.1 menaquinone biosynthesis decarboxylase [Thermus scotoductus]
MFRNLEAYLLALEKRGELKRIRVPVSSELEITEIADRMVKAGGPALLFEKVLDKDFPVAIGLFGTRERTAFALGVRDLDELSEKVARLLELKPGRGGISALMGLLPKLPMLKGFFPKRVRKAPVQEVILKGEAVDLFRLPILKCWPLDGGPFLTLPLVITKDPETGELNVGMYRMQVLDKRSTAMHWQLHKVGRQHLEKARKLGKKLEVAVALGGDPILTYAATAPLPPLPGVSEFHLAGFLRGAPLELTRGVTVDLPVPAEAEFVLEGYIDPEEPLVEEGPFGDHTGFYTPVDLYPRFHVTAITHRKRAIYPATIVGVPPMEDAYLIEASERLFLPPLRLILPEVVDYHMPPEGVAHNWVNVALRKAYPGQAYKVAYGMLGLGQMMFAKVIVAVDGDVPVKPGFQALLEALKHALPGRDTLLLRGPMDVLDHSSRGFAFGGKLILDGTRKLPEEGGEGPFTPRAHQELPHEPEVVAQRQWPGIWGVALRKERPGQAWALAERLLKAPQSAGIRLLLLADHDVLLTPEEVLWAVLNNIDPERDARVMPGVEGPVLVLDGTRKFSEEGFDRVWPERIRMDPRIKALVDSRWEEYGL